MDPPVGPDLGPCTLWIDGEDLAGCCDLPDDSDSGPVASLAAEEASQVLFELSGRRFPGACERTVRPCTQRSCWDPGSWASRGWTGTCGCRPLSQVKLAGGVREITEVKIDGDVLDQSEYRVAQRRWLIRLPDADGNFRRWPSCQRVELADTEPGTFSVTYVWGADPPLAGLNAARQLACELAKACSPGGEIEDCDLPAGVTRVTRQGITFEREALATYLTGSQTGLVHIDAFLSAYGRYGRRQSALWTPDLVPFAREA